MCRHAEPGDFFHLERDITINQIIVKYTTDLQEFPVCVQRLKGLRQACTHGRDILDFFRRQIIEVLIHGRAWINLVNDTVKASHHHGRKHQVAITGRVTKANLDTATLGAANKGDTAGGRAVSGRISQHHRCLISWNQAFVAIG